MLESCPALEAAVDLSDRRWLELLAGFGGAWGIARSGAEGPRAEAAGEAGALEAETAALLEGDETYACLLTVPGIGPRTAAQLAVSVDIGRFPDHDHLASC
nr:IS110 family transposase [Collinsella aerofaciens]